MQTGVFELAKFPIHLGLGATAVVQPEFTGDMAWYESYGQRVADDGVESRLVAMHTFSEPWPTWEVHPKGHEVVICVSGRLTLHQERDEGTVSVVLEPGQAAINPPGVWHTADVDEPTTALFITAGLGTENRPR